MELAATEDDEFETKFGGTGLLLPDCALFTGAAEESPDRFENDRLKMGTGMLFLGGAAAMGITCLRFVFEDCTAADPVIAWATAVCAARCTWA